MIGQDLDHLIGLEISTKIKNILAAIKKSNNILDKIKAIERTKWIIIIFQTNNFLIQITKIITNTKQEIDKILKMIQPPPAISSFLKELKVQN